MASADQQKALDAIFKALDKKHKGAVTTMASGKQGLVRGAVATPLEALDRFVLGVNGLAWERVSEIYGAESSGKSSLVMGTLASVQRAGGIGFYVDAENACTQERADTLGVDKEALLMVPDLDNAEHAGQLLLDTIDAHRSKVPLLAAFDSIPALETKAQAAGDVGDAFMAPMARFLSGYMPKLVRMLKGKNAHVIFVNQTRMKPGVMYGSPEYTPGGNAVKFFSSVRLRLKGVAKRDGGLEVVIKNVKNKLSEPHRELTTFLHFQKGWDNDWTTLNLAKDQGVVEKLSRDVEKARVALGWGPSETAERLGADLATAAKIGKASGKK
jgi:recombination protein RecA